MLINRGEIFSRLIPYEEIYGISIYQNFTKIVWALVAFAFIVLYRKNLYSSICEMFDFKKNKFQDYFNLFVLNVYN